jgi:diguanylate cyclase (GGDEF)-like protein
MRSIAGAGDFVNRLLDLLIGWQGAAPRTRAHLLQTFCASIKPSSLISNSIALLLLAGLVVIETQQPSHIAWLVAVIVGGLLPRGYAAYLRRRDQFEQAPERKALTFVAISGLYGLLWGAGPFLLLPQISGTAVGILLVVMVFGTIMGPYASMPGILYVRLATTGLPTLAAVALYTTPQITFVCVVLAVWLTLRTDIWRGYHRTLRRLLALQEALEARRAELEQANRDKDAANRRLREMAETDPLTGVANRRHFMQRIVTLRGPAALLLLDIDHFKAINDEFGHEAGDRVLIEFAGLVQDILRERDLLARLGGEEFAIILENAHIKDAWSIAERVRTRVEQHVVSLSERAARVTVSVGVATVPLGAAKIDAAALLRQADAALYVAKNEGRNRTHTSKQATEEAVGGTQDSR